MVPAVETGVLWILLWTGFGYVCVHVCVCVWVCVEEVHRE